MMEEADLHLQFCQERENYLKLKPRKFSLTNMKDSPLLQAIGMDAEFDLIVHIVSWEDFWDVSESSSRFFTIP
jgi:hypothetical protein